MIRAILVLIMLPRSLSYAWIIRKLQISSISSVEPHDEDACRDLFARAVPFLFDRKSLTRLESAQEAVNYVQSRVEEPLEKVRERERSS